MLRRIRTASLPLSFSVLPLLPLRRLQPTPTTKPLRNAAAATPQEQRAIRAFNAAKQEPARTHRLPRQHAQGWRPSHASLRSRLRRDLHQEWRCRLLCVNPANHSFFKPAATTRSLPPQPVCGEGNVRASDAFKDQKLYDALVDSFSMRSFVPSAGVSGHDQFFATFGRFGGIDKSHTGEWLDEVATRAAAQNEQYLEIMETPIFSDVAKLSSTIGWPSTPVDPAMNRTGDATGTTREDLSNLRDALLAGGPAR